MKRRNKAGLSLASYRRLCSGAFLLLLIVGRYWESAFATGSLTSVHWFGVLHLVDPLAALENLIANRAWTADVAVGGAILALLSALLLGRAFCAWLCPLGLLLDLNDVLRRTLQHKGNKRLGPRRLKYWVLILVLLLAAFSALPIFQTFSPINYLVWLAVFAVDASATSLLIGTLPLLFLVVVEWISPRLWCRSLCPVGAFYSLIGRFGVWRIKIGRVSEKPYMCGACTRECSMGIQVMEQFVHDDQDAIRDPECTRCGDCVDICPQERLCEGVAFPV